MAALPHEIAVSDGRSFVLTDELGDTAVSTRHGLFQSDTRFLSRYRLALGDQRPLPVSVTQRRPDRAIFRATNADLPGLPAGTVALTRHRRLSGHLTDYLCMVNHGSQPVTTVLRLELAADFADVLELRAVPAAKLRPTGAPPPAGWEYAFAYQRDRFAWYTLVRWLGRGQLLANVLELAVTLPAHTSWHEQIEVAMLRTETSTRRLHVVAPVSVPHHTEPARRRPDQRTGPRRVDSDPALRAYVEHRTLPRAVLARARSDLRALRLDLPTGEVVVGAGMPDFMTLFGRDSLLTAYQTLTLDPDLAASVLQALARHQGRTDDPVTDQEPGKMPHEVRGGELALCGDLPHSCYYGTVDATPLFLILLAEYVRRSGDVRLPDALWPAAEAALAWIDRYGDRDGDGFVEYLRRAPKGLDNQGWKDSWDAVRFPDGRLARGPIALCEVQGYVYAAKRGMAQLYAERGDPARAAALQAEARALQERFDAAFWLPEQGTYALALDGDKRPVDTITSNPGHCLWSGIAHPARAQQVAARLLGEDLFSGWGLRTLSTRMAAYDPLSYHNGSVWPHDTVLAAAGLLRYGHRAAARRLLAAILAAAARFPRHRLPELFAGIPRTARAKPVPYPQANAPQAWAAGAVVLATVLLARMDAELGAPGERVRRHRTAAVNPGARPARAPVSAARRCHEGG